MSSNSTKAIETPERPVLAPGVVLSGEMQESGFRDRQWLIQRNGTFIQVSELIYRVAEHADGNRTLADIAEELTRLTDWSLEPEHVAHLVNTKLLPLGVIAADGAARAANAGAPKPAATTLGFTMRKPLFGPSALEALSRVLQVLYVPRLLIPLLVLVGGVHFWLYLVHGVGVPLQATLLTPGWLLAAIGVYLVSGIVHELGHAAALRFGGGRARALGVGIYLIYPAFYTDTSDSYRLGRWARVRTDLGGFYFHLLFASALVGAYLLTGQPYLLVAVLFINLDILIQCIPFLRFDGYWTLNDLTGIPDLFSQMAPLARSMVPGSEGPRLPPLKPWARAVFIGFALLTVPLLVTLMVGFAIRLPTMVTFIWSSIENQLGAFANARRGGDVGIMLASLGQLSILALPLLTIPFLLYRLVWRAAMGLWGSRRPAARLSALMLLTAVAALATFYWYPRTSMALAGRIAPEGVQSFDIGDTRHVDGPVSYSQTPPAGGSHAPEWQNCGFYATPVADENAVHSIEHGAVWITYGEGLREREVEALKELGSGRTHVLMSPHRDLPERTVVASAWGRQLVASSVDDERLRQFVEAYHLGSQAPERGAPCTGGIGEPEAF